MKSPKTALVTGVSSGIGRAIASRLLNEGWYVFGSVRKQSDAEEARSALGQNFEPLLFDVTDRQAINEAATQVKRKLGGRTLSGLVNNAGIAVAGPVASLPEQDLAFQFDVNVYGPLRVTQAFLPALGVDKSLAGAPGRIVNMSSVAGKIASPFMSPYAMSKHALEAMSESLRRELLIHDIDVIIIGPGAVKTPIWSKADDLDIDQYRETEYITSLEKMKSMMQSFGNDGLDPAEIGALTYKALTNKKPKTRYAALNNKFFNWTLPRLLPPRLVDRAIAKRFGIKG